MTTIHLDAAATTRVDPRVVDAMMPFLLEHFGNPSSPHRAGKIAKQAVARARDAVRALLCAARADEIVFTSGGTESDNLAIRSALDADPTRREVVISAFEHPAVATTCAMLAARHGVKVHVVPVDRHGRVDIGAYGAALSERVALVSVMWANNETGVVAPVEDLATRAKAVGAIFHTDAVQAVARMPITLAGSAIDMLSLSGHKFHAPKGVGALYVKRGTPFAARAYGGRQERGRRAGTENVPGIVALGEAATLALARMTDDSARIAMLRDRLEAGVLAIAPDALVLGGESPRVPNVSCIAFAALDGEAVVARLDRHDIMAATGSACSSGGVEPSRAARAMGVPPSHLHGVVRFSLDRDTSEADIARVLGVLPGIVGDLRGDRGADRGSAASLHDAA